MGDVWTSTQSFATLFYFSYDPSPSKGKVIQSFLLRGEQRNSWNLEFKKELTDAELEEFAQLTVHLESANLDFKKRDSRIWRWEKQGILFSQIRSTVCFLQDTGCRVNCNNLISKLRLPNKKFFCMKISVGENPYN